MIFVDTNYFLRFLLKDIEKQHLEAKQLFLDGALGKVKLVSSIIVFFEIGWVLRSIYKKDKSSLSEVLAKILELSVKFEDHLLLIKSLEYFKKTNLSLEDCFNIAYARSRKVKVFKTFDEKLLKEFSKI